MSWIDDKDLGLWDFTAQPNKPHYNEGNLISDRDNPVWSTDHSGVSITPTHHPWCGYWTKESVSEDLLDVNIYVLNHSGPPNIYGVHFDGRRLYFIGGYQSAEDLNGLILNDDNLLTIAGTDTFNRIRRISTNAVDENLPLLNTYDTFNSYDTRNIVTGRLVNGDSGKIYYADDSSVQVSINADLTRDKRGFRHTVITGTDGNLYVLHAGIFRWEASWHPITGDDWSIFWSFIEDNICNTPITNWGEDPIETDGSIQTDLCYHNGFLYTVDSSSYTSPIRKINPSSLEIETTHTGSFLYLNRIVVHNDKVYATGGLTSTTVYCFDADSLSLICSIVLPSGRALDGDLEVVGDYLIVSATAYGGSAATLYKLSLDNFSIIDSVSGLAPTDDTIGVQRLTKINDSYVAAAYNNGISVYNTDYMALRDFVGINLTLYGYHAQAMVVRHN